MTFFVQVEIVMSLSRNEHAHPFALLDRRQSRRVLSMPIGDNLQSVMARKTEAPPYDDLINFPRAKDKDDIRCVMCGLPPGMGCVIPRQNKDVCKVSFFSVPILANFARGVLWYHSLQRACSISQSLVIHDNLPTSVVHILLRSGM